MFNRCWTAPTGPSSTLNLEEVTPNLSRSKTDKEKKPRLTETLYHTPSPAERLSERKRVGKLIVGILSRPFLLVCRVVEIKLWSDTLLALPCV